MGRQFDSVYILVFVIFTSSYIIDDSQMMQELYAIYIFKSYEIFEQSKFNLCYFVCVRERLTTQMAFMLRDTYRNR